MDPTCEYPHCGRPVCALGLCAGHYQQHRRGKPLQPLRQRRGCTVAGCDRIHYALGLCQRHYQRLRRIGQVELQPPPVRRCTECGAVAIKRDMCQRCYQRWYYHARLKQKG